MIDEIAAATTYIASLFAPPASSTFVEELTRLLEARYRGHWHSDDPERGSGYRCLAQTGWDRQEPLVTQAFEAAGQHTCKPRIARWTVFVDPGCVSARLGETSGTLQEVWGTLPQYSQPATDLGAVDNLPTLASPVKRENRAIQIVRPESRSGGNNNNVQQPSTPGAHVSIIPPTPLTARPSSMRQPSFVPASETATAVLRAEADRSVTPTVADPFARSPSRSSETSSSGGSEGGQFSDRGSDRGSVFSATSHETLFPNRAHISGANKRPNTVSHHRHTSSTSTAASSNSAGTSASSISRPGSAASGSVVEHSNGKVGVLGGGVLLGVPSSSNSSDDLSGIASGGIGHHPSGVRRSRGRGRSRARSANYHAAQQQQQAIMAGRWPFPDATLAF